MAKKRRKNSQESKRKTTKRNISVLEYEIMKMMEHSLKAAIDSAFNTIFKDW